MATRQIHDSAVGQDTTALIRATTIALDGAVELGVASTANTIRAVDASGANQAGADIVIQVGAGTGTGTPGLLYVRTPSIGSTGSTPHTQVDRVIVGGSSTQTTVLIGNPDTDNRVSAPINTLIAATDGNSTTAAGALELRAGNAYGDASGGDLTLRSGSTASAFGFGSRAGDVIVAVGDATDSNVTEGSFIVQTSGTERFRIDSAGAWLLASSAGSSGQFLRSNGAAAAPTWAAAGGGGGGGGLTVGTATIDFGAGDDIASVAVTGQASIVSTSTVFAKVRVEDTADHTIDEIVIDPLNVQPGPPVTGTGFTIYATGADGKTRSGQYVIDWGWQ